jgi:hypothetical protein
LKLFCQGDAGKREPDFLFSTRAAYADSAFPAERLRMLAENNLQFISYPESVS